MYNLLQGYNYTTLLNWNMIRTVTQWMEQHMTDRPKISIFLRPAHNLVHTTTMGPTRVGRKAGVWVTGKSWMAQRETDIPAPSQVTASTDWETWVMVTCIFFWGQMTQFAWKGRKKRQGTFLLHWKFSVAVADMAHNQESVQLPLKWSGIGAPTVWMSQQDSFQGDLHPN